MDTEEFEDRKQHSFRSRTSVEIDAYKSALGNEFSFENNSPRNSKNEQKSTGMTKGDFICVSNRI